MNIKLDITLEEAKLVRVMCAHYKNVCKDLARGKKDRATRDKFKAVASCVQQLDDKVAVAVELGEAAVDAEAMVDAVTKPIGSCPKCGAPVYTEQGFCGGCRAAE